MLIQILGGGSNQVNGIKKAVEKGHEVVLTDYYENAPGRAYAKYNEVISTFDVEGNIEVAKKYGVDGIMTLGTDQPVYTVSKVAQELSLPRFLDVKVAKAVTNKEIMKKTFIKYNIPTVNYKFIDVNYTEEEIENLNFPVVLKPLDSQGQRGIYKLHTLGEVKRYISDTLSYSREQKALIEEYYQSDEMTVSAWVTNGKSHILTITDRETFERANHIGICFAHTFPSKHYPNCHREIEKIIEDIVNAFSIENGPLYVQLLVGGKGIVVNEIACRIGGAYEDIFIPYLTGVDILDMVIDYSLGKTPKDILGSAISPGQKFLSVQLFFAKPGKVKRITPVKELLKLPGIISVGYNITEGQELCEIKDATARAGYMVITGHSKEVLYKNIRESFTNLSILDENKKNLVIKPWIYE